MFATNVANKAIMHANAEKEVRLSVDVGDTKEPRD